MAIESILKKLIREPFERSQCSICLSICLTYIEMENWERAKCFLTCSKELMTDYEEQVAVDVLENILRTESIEDVRKLLAYLKA